MVSLVNSHKNATRTGWHLWEIDLRLAPGLPPGRLQYSRGDAQWRDALRQKTDYRRGMSSSRASVEK